MKYCDLVTWSEQRYTGCLLKYSDDKDLFAFVWLWSRWLYKRMKFRQRIAWLLLFLYLLLTVFAVYYLFELSDQYNTLALEHTKLFHSPSSEQNNLWISAIWNHLPDIPFFIWILILAVPYLQVFFCLYMCTKPEPKQLLIHYVPFVIINAWASSPKPKQNTPLYTC